MALLLLLTWLTVVSNLINPTLSTNGDEKSTADIISSIPANIKKPVVAQINNGAIFKRQSTYRPTHHVYLAGFVIQPPPLPDLSKTHFALNCDHMVDIPFDHDFKQDLCVLFRESIEEINAILDVRKKDLTNIIKDIELINPHLFRSYKVTEEHNRSRRNVIGQIVSYGLGLATKDHVRRFSHMVKGFISDLNAGLQASNKVMASLTSAFAVSQDNLVKVNDKVYENSLAIHNNAEAIRNIRWDLNKESLKATVNAYSIRFVANLTTHIYTDGIRLASALTELIENWREFEHALLSA